MRAGFIARATRIRAPEHNTTPLHEATANHADAAEIKRLIEEGADIMSEASNGETPLHFAASDNPNPAVLETGPPRVYRRLTHVIQTRFVAQMSRVCQAAELPQLFGGAVAIGPVQGMNLGRVRHSYDYGQ